MRKRIIVMLSLIIVIVLSYVLINFYVSNEKINIKYNTEIYLKDKGVKDSEIKSIEVRHSFMNLVLSFKEWSIRVQYNDEPDVAYFYTYQKGKIYEIGIVGEKRENGFKHENP